MQALLGDDNDRPSAFEGRRVLVIGRLPEVNRRVVEPLRALGIAAEGFTQPEQASARFNAKDFELIVFGRGVLGALSDRVKREFSRQNADVFGQASLPRLASPEPSLA